MGKLNTYIDTENKFIEIFNPKNGFYVRTGVLDEHSVDTGIDPFMRNYPSLLDIGIMGHCAHGLSGLCLKSGTECYQDGLNIKKSNMTFEDFKTIADQCENKTFQFALGGRGDANKHESFEDILAYSTSKGIVCNYTTSGLALTDREADITKEFCGACAISEYRSSYTRKAIELLVKKGVKTNIHFVLGNNTIDEAIRKLKNNDIDKGVNAIIFLLHKPIGLGSWNNVLLPTDPRVKTFYEIVDSKIFDFKIGFDSCSCSGIVNFTKNIMAETIEPCESGRHSAYIDADMNIMPCSFCNQDKGYFVSLNKYSISDAWYSKPFVDFREKQKNSCPDCKLKEYCLPCGAINGISLCRK